MQVSWIEPDQLRDLVGQLKRPAGKASNLAWELHTLPNPVGLGARDLGIEDGDLWLPDPQQTSPDVPAVPANEPAEELFSPAIAVEDLQQKEGDRIPAPQPEQPKELNRIREKLQAIRERAIQAGLLAHVGLTAEARVEEPAAPVVEPELPPTQEAEVSENLLPISSPFALADPVVESAPVIAIAPSSGFETPPGTLTDRLEAFASWAARQFGLNDLLIVDDHGDILWGIHEHAGLVVSAMMACKAAMRSSALGAAGLSSVIEQPISIDRMLVVVPCETGYGTLSIAFVNASPFPRADALQLRETLRIVIESGGDLSSSGPTVGAALD